MSGFFDYFQISGLIVFLCLFAGKTLYLGQIKKIRAVTLTGGSRGIEGILVLSLVVAITAWVVVVFTHVTSHDTQFLPSSLDIRLIDAIAGKIVGAALIVLGLVVYILALITLGDSWRVGIDKEKPGELVTWGIYAISRNPIYVFFILYFIGTFLVNGNLVFLIFAILVVLNSHYLILEEERFLSRTYGPAFYKYCSTTSRYLTWQKTWRIKG